MIKIKNLGSTKDNVMRIKKKVIGQEKIIATRMSTERFVSRTYQNFKAQKTSSQPSLKMDKTLRYFIKGSIWKA